MSTAAITTGLEELDLSALGAVVESNRLRENLIQALARYREKVLRWNTAVLKQEIMNTKKHNRAEVGLLEDNVDSDRKLGRKEEKRAIESVIEWLWRNNSKEARIVSEQVHRLSDFDQHIPTGFVEPMADQQEQTRILDSLEVSINQDVDPIHGYLQIPEEYRILFTLVGGVYGAGYMNFNVINLFDEPLEYFASKKPEEILIDCMLDGEEGLEIAAGWLCGYRDMCSEGRAYVVYMRSEPEGFPEWRWRYLVAYTLDTMKIYESIAEIIDEYCDRCRGYLFCHVQGLALDT